MPLLGLECQIIMYLYVIDNLPKPVERIIFNMIHIAYFCLSFDIRTNIFFEF